MGGPVGARGAGDKDRRGQPQWRGKAEVWLARDVLVERRLLGANWCAQLCQYAVTFR
jgi:hypothetical protein